MYLAIAKGHVLCQWQNDDGTRLNFEVSGNDGDCSRYGDEHYYGWPRPMSTTDLASGRYLRPLTRREELALFIETRGHCLTDNGRFAEARIAYQQASRAAPGWSEYQNQIRSLAVLEAASIGLHVQPIFSCFTTVSISGIEF